MGKFDNVQLGLGWVLMAEARQFYIGQIFYSREPVPCHQQERVIFSIMPGIKDNSC